MDGLFPFLHLGSSFEDTVPGNDWELMFPGTERCSGAIVKNESATLDLYVYLNNKDESAPGAGTTLSHYEIPPKGTLTIEFGYGIAVYGKNSSGGATTSSVTARLIKR